MQISETVEWGLHACLALAMLPRGARVPAKALAEYHGIKTGYFSKAMQRLVAAGIVHSVEGRSGGLALARSAEDVTVLQIFHALEGRGGFFRCTEIRQKGPCAAAPNCYRTPCAIARVMYKADEAWRSVLDQTTLADLRKNISEEPVPGVLEATEIWLRKTGAVRGV